jgi:hypothetical protein
MNNKLIPIAVVLATAALLATVATTPFAYAEGDGHYKRGAGDQRSETNEELKSEGDCNFSGKGNTCLQIPINIEAVVDAGI